MICEKLSVSFGTSSSAVGSTMKTTSYCLFVSKIKPPVRSLSIKFTHRFQSAVPDDRSYRVCALRYHFFNYGPLAACKRVEHKTLRVRDRMFGLNTDPQSYKFIRADRCDDRLEPVMPACRAAFSNAKAA